MKYKFINQYEPEFGQEEADAVYSYMQTSAWLTEHIKTKKFEQKISEFLEVKHSIAVNNGTISLSLALLALGVKKGDGVIVPSLTMIATANAVKLIGALPIFCDVEPNTLCLDTDKAIRLTEHWKIKAIIYVSLNGRRNCTRKLRTYCKANKIGFIEDGAQAFGSGCKSMKIGNLADITSFSLSPHKIISTGQGGLLTTNNDELAIKIRRLKDFGRDKGGNDIHDYFGINSKFTDIQAIIGIEQLKKIHKRILIKKAMYERYQELLQDVKEVKFLPINANVTWFMDIFVEKRNELAQYLKEKGIGTRNLYSPIHQQKCYNHKITLPIAEKYSIRGLWLPSSFNVSFIKIYRVCDAIKKFYKEKE